MLALAGERQVIIADHQPHAILAPQLPIARDATVDATSAARDETPTPLLQEVWAQARAAEQTATAIDAATLAFTRTPSPTQAAIPHTVAPQLGATINDLAGQLAESSQRVYRLDIAAFLLWLDAQQLQLSEVDRTVVIAYRAHLVAARYAKSTAARRLTVVRRLLDEAVLHGLLPANPAAKVRGFREVGADESPHIALDIPQLRALLAAIEARAPHTPLVLRDLALIALLARTGLRREEASQLDREDLSTERGHAVLTIRRGKGDKRRIVKVPVDVHRLLLDYCAAVGQTEIVRDDRSGTVAQVEHPLFVAHWKGGRPRIVAAFGAGAGDSYEGHVRLDGKGIERTVARHGRAIGLTLTPHDLRTTFITLALEGGAKLEQVQYAVGHADPRTTLHYQRRKLNLDNNAVDYIRL